MKSFKKVAVTILAAVMMLLISTTVFAADSPVKTSFNASLTKKTVTYTGKKQQPKVVVKNEAGKTIKAKYYTVKVKTCKNAGTYKVTIIGKGKYAGYTQTLTYKIKAKTQKVTLKSADKYTVKASAVYNLKLNRALLYVIIHRKQYFLITLANRQFNFTFHHLFQIQSII